ncbi:MAG: DUF4032 domain-containing protein [Acidimicrobiales bacterium]
MVALKLKTFAEPSPDFLNLQWSTPLDEWPEETAVRLPRGRHRHIVRFIEHDGQHYALKELPGQFAELEYRNLEFLGEADLPVVELVGIATDRVDDAGRPLDSVLITKHLTYALPYLHLFAGSAGPKLHVRVVDALAILLVRLHLNGFFWGDCSLGNALFRRDAGALMAYLVDTETSEIHETLTDGQRALDLSIATDNFAGGLFELEAMGKLSPDIDPIDVVELLQARYDQLWNELTATRVVNANELWQIHQRLARLNELGFDTIELEIVERDGKRRIEFRPRVVEEGHHRRELHKLTGIEAQENQARRLLGALYGYGAWLANEEGKELPIAIQAYRWLMERYHPTLDKIPDNLRSRLYDAELYHQILDHLWYLSEAAGTDVGITVAVENYRDTILASLPDERSIIEHD